MHAPTQFGAALGCSRVDAGCLALERCVPIQGCFCWAFPLRGARDSHSPWQGACPAHGPSWSRTSPAMAGCPATSCWALTPSWVRVVLVSQTRYF